MALAASTIAHAQTLRVIPYPAHVETGTQECPLSSEPKIFCSSAGLGNEAGFLGNSLSGLGYRPEIVPTAGKSTKGIELLIDATLPEEGYMLETRPNGTVRISGGSPAGVFYGIQTLLQQLENGGVRAGVVRDAPRYPWRGFMLDEARHFSGEARVKLLLDMMARYKMNRFHWHLTDEQGWRIEIERYPLLSTVGGAGNNSDPDAPVNFYTQKQIRDIVAYAATRHIMVIPEIDMPGHATAANRAYPEYSGGGTPEHPEFTFNVGKEETYTYLTNILREVAGLFPSPYMHIGGDEVAFGIKAWESDPHVQALMQREGLRTVKEAERYFMHRMTDSVRTLGKTLVGWDELLDLGLDNSDTVIMWWRHDRSENLRRSLAEGFTTILCPRRPLYFDFVQHDSHKWGRRWDGFAPLEDVYAFPDGLFSQLDLPSEQMPLITGIQANLWTELVHDPERADFMIFPRLCALAESAWSAPEVKNYYGFMSRMEDSFALFDRLGINYFDPRDPSRHPEPAAPVIRKRAAVDMSNFRD